MTVKTSINPFVLNDPLLIEIRDYWNDHIHDLEVATEPVGSLGFFNHKGRKVGT